MTTPQDVDRHSAAYHGLKTIIDDTHPHGSFVAVADGRIIAADSHFHALESKLRAQGMDPKDVLVVEAGMEYPETVTIFI